MFLGVDNSWKSYIKRYEVESSGVTVDTGISVNQYYFGLTILAIASNHDDDGNRTGSSIDMIRCGYDGGNWEVINIASIYHTYKGRISYTKTSRNTIGIYSNWGAISATFIFS